MALKHLDKLWMDAPTDLVEQVARKLCERQGTEIFGVEAVTEEFLDDRWICFASDARDAIALVRAYDGKP